MEVASSSLWSSTILGSSVLGCRSTLSFSEAIAGTPLRASTQQQQQQHHRHSQQEQRYRQFPCVKAADTVAPPPRKKKVKASKLPNAPPSRRPSVLSLREAILKPPLGNPRIANRFLLSPQLTLKTLPLCSSLLPQRPLRREDLEWMDDFLPEAKVALGYPLHGMITSDRQDPGMLNSDPLQSPNPCPPSENPLSHFDALLYLAFQHGESKMSRKSKSVRIAHSRLAFLGQYILDLALVEYFLQRYPRESPASIRERVYALTNKSALPRWIKAASLDRVLFENMDMDDLRTNGRLQSIKAAFRALIGAIYVAMGIREVYRLLFEVLGLDPDHKSCQPKPRVQEDVDFVFPQLEEVQMSWQNIASIKTDEDPIFAKPLLYRACVPPGMQRFRKNLWEVDSLPEVLKVLGYPHPSLDEDPSITLTRNSELELGLQLCFLHPSMYKREHPRYCNERFEYLGSVIQDVIMAERLLMKHLDGPGFWLALKHRRLLFNRVCGKYLREKKLQSHIIMSESRHVLFEKARRFKNYATVGASLALHGLAYAVYGKAEVRRLMFQVLDFERENLNETDQILATTTFDRIGGRLSYPSYKNAPKELDEMRKLTQPEYKNRK